MQIEIRHARVIAALAEAGSISKAAQRLILPQPSLTMKLRRIETALGGALFARSSTGIVPTVLGERIIPLMVDLAKRADDIVSEASSVSTGIVRVANSEWTPVGLRAELTERLPDVDVQTVTLDHELCLSAVGQELLTASLLSCVDDSAPTSHDPDLHTELIVREPMWLALPENHALAGSTGVTRAQLAALFWVRHQRGHWFHEVEENLFTRMGVPESTVLHRSGSQAETMSWVSGADAGAFAGPSGPVSAGVSFAAPLEPVWRRIVLVYQRGSVSPDHIRRIVEAARATYCALARGVPEYWRWLVEHREEFPELEFALRDEIERAPAD